MTREEAKHFWPIIKAYSEGKTIEYLLSEGKWATINEDFLFDNSHERFRIKQEAKYRPFTSKDECWEEMLKHQPFGWLISKESRNYICVSKVSTSITSNYALIVLKDTEHYSDSVFNNYTFLDGTPFGIKDE